MKGLIWLAAFCCALVLAAPARAVPPGWASAGSLLAGRDNHTQTVLSDGSVLVVGGYIRDDGLVSNTAERYFPASNAWLPAIRKHKRPLLVSRCQVAGAKATACRPVPDG
jgi:hypothetical protein